MKKKKNLIQFFFQFVLIFFKQRYPTAESQGLVFQDKNPYTLENLGLN